MPIRLNLLAEAQAAEEMRRKDPVKRAVWIGALLVCLMLVWSSSLQLKGIILNAELSRNEGAMKSFTNDFSQVIENQKKLQDVNHKLASLDRFSTNRFLQANALNALQHTIVEDVQLLHLKSEQTFAFTDEIKTRTNGTRVVIGKPPTATERIVFSIEGSDCSSNPGDQALHYKEAVATNTFFNQWTGKPTSVALKSLSPPDLQPNGKRSVLFTLECRFPEITR